jgi:L-alanine-DL-glutamate epimerase-like enolase superfamily enzyme
MKCSYQSFSLEFKHPFGVSSNTRKETPTVFIRIEAGDQIGYGEACLPAYLGETVEGTLSFFDKVKPLLTALPNTFDLTQTLFQIDQSNMGCNAAKAAIDIALHDLKGKQEGKSIAALYNLEKPEPRHSSFTIGIDREEVLVQKLKEAEDFSILKIKAGTKKDKALIELIRRHSEKPLYVDVNQGWTDAAYVLDMIHWMKEQNVVLVEQPMPVQMKKEMAWVTERSPLPTVADESVKRLSDLEKLEGTFSGVNIKLMKCTGIAEALKMIKYCKAHGLATLLGCMAESSCATSAMAQLTGLADYIDLDAPLLYKNDPFEGVEYKHGKISTMSRPGTGAIPAVSLF